MKAKHHLGFVLAIVGLVGPAETQPGPEDLRLTIGKSIVIDYPSDIARLSTSNPDIVDASPVTAREILLHGKSLGTATLIVWSKSGERSFYNLNVEQNLEPLRRLLAETFPTDRISVQSSRESLSLTGYVSSKDISERAAALAAPFAKTVVNNLQLIPSPVDKQILLRVKFAELDRNASTQFAVNLVSTGAANTIGRTTTGAFPAPSPTTISGQGAFTSNTFTIADALNIFAFRPDLNLGALIKALQNQSILQILAEPNLVTANGKEASFLVGGEFPVPVLQGGANSGAVTIQFREFGVRLTFTPVITANGTIRMHVKPEVSSLDYANSVSISGFTVPALSTRKMETEIELGEGQSFVIAGLLDNQLQDSLSHIPGLANIPILGYLFRGKDTSKSRTELIVMVTPEITMPLLAGDPKPSIVMPEEFLPVIRQTSEKPAAASGSRKK